MALAFLLDLLWDSYQAVIFVSESMTNHFVQRNGLLFPQGIGKMAPAYLLAGNRISAFKALQRLPSLLREWQPICIVSEVYQHALKLMLAVRSRNN